MCPEADRCLAGMFSEKGVEMGRVLECEAVGNFFSRVSGLRQQGFCFEEDLLMDEIAGRLACAFLYDGAEMVGVYQELACIKVDCLYFVADLRRGYMTLDGLMESYGKRSTGCCRHGWGQRRLLGRGGVDVLQVGQ